MAGNGGSHVHRRAPAPGASRAALLAALLAVLTLAVFWPVTGHEFVAFDDDLYVYRNPQVAAGLTAAGMRWAFTTFHAFNWHPLTWLSHQLDAQFFGLRPGGHHLVSLLLHLVTALLLFVLLVRLTGSRGRCFLVAALFAVHPQHVESVAWVAERKDVLSALFWMLALAAWLFHLRRPGRGRYLLSLLLLGLGLAAKPMLVSLPAVLLLLDWWPLGRWRTVPRWSLLAEKIPFLALAAASGAVTFLAQARGGTVALGQELPLGWRTGNALVSAVVYLRRTAWPSGLAVFYPHPQESLPLWQPALALAILAAVTAMVLRRAGRRPALAAGWLWYLVTLLPVIGLVQVGAQANADRYTYLPLIGIFVMAAWVPLTPAIRRKASGGLLLAVTAAAVAGAALAAARQVHFWKTTERLFGHTLRVTRDNWVIEHHLARHLADSGRDREAEPHYREALRLRPAYAQARLGLGILLTRGGRVEEALPNLERAAREEPGNPAMFFNLGLAYSRLPDPARAENAYRQALRLRPEYPEARNNLGTVVAGLGQREEAMEQFREAIRLRPGYERAHYNLAATLMEAGRTSEAIGHYREALRINPGYRAAREGLERALAPAPRTAR